MDKVDFLVIGAGAAGLSGALYAARSGLSVLVLDSDSSGGQAGQIDILENCPGVFPPVSGGIFIDNLKKQAVSFGARILSGSALSISRVPYAASFSEGQASEKNLNGLEVPPDTIYEFSVSSTAGEIRARSVLFATGASPKKLGCPGEEEFYAKGVSYCAVCDGPFFRKKKVVVVGGGDSACTEAVYLSSIASEVYLVHRRATFRAQKANALKILKMDNITVLLNTKVLEICGEGKPVVSSIKIQNVITEKESALPADAVFIFAGREPDTSVLSTLYGVRLDESGYVITDENMQTSVPGFFCAGDVRKKALRQIVTACSDGAVAAFNAEKYISDLKIKGYK